jgi:hypothetical protein
MEVTRTYIPTINENLEQLKADALRELFNAELKAKEVLAESIDENIITISAELIRRVEELMNAAKEYARCTGSIKQYIPRLNDDKVTVDTVVIDISVDVIRYKSYMAIDDRMVMNALEYILAEFGLVNFDLDKHTMKVHTPAGGVYLEETLGYEKIYLTGFESQRFLIDLLRENTEHYPVRECAAMYITLRETI